jgi:hypothetical protein
MFQKVFGRNLNTTKILQENYIPKVAYKMFFGMPNFRYCTINVTIINSIAGINEKKVPCFYLINVDKKHCNVSFPEISCDKTSICTKKLVCCDATKIEEVEECYDIRTINRCNMVKTLQHA